MSKLKRFSEEIAELLLDKIDEWGLKDGDRLPAHSKLAEQLHVSVPSLREGLELLSLAGVVKITHGTGTMVSAPCSEDYFRILNLASRISTAHLEDVSVLLSLISAVVSAELVNASQVNMDKLKTLCILEEPPDPDEFIKRYKEFHLELASLVANTLVKEVFLIGLNLVFTHSGMKKISLSAIDYYLHAHRMLLKVLSSGDREKVPEYLKKCYNFQVLSKMDVSFIYDSFGTGSPGGSFYSIASRIVKTLNSKSSVNIHLELTGGGVENIELTEEGKIILGLTQSDIADAAFRGTGIFNKKHSHLRAICRMRALDLWIISRKTGYIESLYDLKGCRIAMGAAGGDSSIISRSILKKLGFSPEEYRAYFLPISNAVEDLFKNEVDVVFYLSSGMPSIIGEYLDKLPMRLLEIPDEILTCLEKENSYWKCSEIRSVLTPFNVRTISVSSILITGSWISDDLVYQLTSELITGCEDIDRSFLNNYREISIPLHSGAEKALMEFVNV